MNDKSFLCIDCKQVKSIKESGGTGYGTDKNGNKICYDCCGIRDKKEMEETGKMILYFVPDTQTTNEKTGLCHITNWPNTLRFNGGFSVGRHNIAGKRYDVSFVFNGFYWHGITYGDNTQICHCRRTKEKVK